MMVGARVMGMRRVIMRMRMIVVMVMIVVMAVIRVMFVILRMPVPLIIARHYALPPCESAAASRRPAASASTAPHSTMAHTIIEPEGRSVATDATSPST